MKLYHRKTDTYIVISEEESGQYSPETGWEQTEAPELTLAEMKQILTDNGVKFHKNAKKPTVVKLLEGLVNEAK